MRIRIAARPDIGHEPASPLAGASRTAHRCPFDKRSKHSPLIEVRRSMCETEGFSEAVLEGVIKDIIERAFVDGKADLTTERLLRSAQETVPLAEVMKDTGREYTEKFQKVEIQERIVESRAGRFVPRSVPNPD